MIERRLLEGDWLEWWDVVRVQAWTAAAPTSWPPALSAASSELHSLVPALSRPRAHQQLEQFCRPQLHAHPRDQQPLQ